MSDGVQTGGRENKLGRWLPRSLSSQLFLFTALALGAAILSYAAYSAHHQSQMADKMMSAQMSALAASLAEVSVGSIVTGEMDVIEEVIMQSIHFPGVLSILVVDEKGRPLIEVLSRDGKHLPRYSSEAVPLPEGSALTQQADDELFASWRLIFDARMEKTVWRPIAGGSTLGWVRITFSQKETHDIILRVWASALLFSGLAIGAALFLLAMLLRYPMRALAAATQFAGRLDSALGEQMPVSSMAAELEALGSALNTVSKRLKLQDDALTENAEYTRHVVDNIVDGIITIDCRGIVQSFNDSAVAIFGYAPEEVIGNNIRMLMPDPYCSEHDAYLARYMDTGIPHIIGIGREVKGRRKDGSTFPMDLAVSQGTHQGQPLFIGLVRDITERKRIDQMKSEFISTVSHELRTPLTSIRGSLALIVGGVVGELPPAVKPLVEIAHKNSERLILLVNDILDMEKIEAGKMEFDMQPVMLMPLLTQTLDGNRAYGELFNVSYELESSLSDVMVKADANRLMQVFANLLSNAAKFSPAGGKVIISVERADNIVRVSVKDNGSGIPDEFKGQIFQKFAQADASDTKKKGGTGLGLSITKAIIEQMGGNIGFTSQPNVLTTFFVEFPVWHKAEISSNLSETTGRKRVLICEDDPDIAALLRMMLEQAQLVADIAYDAAQAKQLLGQQPYAAMTLDLSMPNQDGLSLIRELRADKATAGLPIVVVSAYASEGRKELNGDAFSVIDWIGKPIDQVKLVEALKQAVGQVSEARSQVLHVEDDQDIAQVVTAIVGELADVDNAPTLAVARRMLKAKHYDLAILDMSLPDGYGLDLLPELNTAKPAVPVMVFSASEMMHEDLSKVKSALVKSRTDNAQLLATIKRLIGDA